MKRTRKEAPENLGPDRFPTDTKTLKYMKVALKETLQLFPPSSYGLQGDEIWTWCCDASA
ncbi:hypothetical protein BDM02DRAFT_3112158, partial [Thelephora ganbajun]